MIDDLREQASELAIDENEPAVSGTQTYQDIILGMTPAQRFIIAVMLLMTTCLVSAFCLLVTGKIALPFA